MAIIQISFDSDACLVINPPMVVNLAALFNCMLIDRLSEALCWLRFGWDPELVRLLLVHGGSTDFLLLQISSGVVWQSRELHLLHNTFCLCIFIVLNRDLFVTHHDSLTS